MNYTKRVPELIFGVAILSVVIMFLIYVIINVVNKRTSSYIVIAKFNEIGGLSVGAQVMIHGVAIGSVAKIAINKDYNVEVYMDISSDINIPIDSKVLIKDTSFFSGRKIEISPGNATHFVKNHGKLINTIDYMYLEDKISTIIFNK